MQVFGKYKTLHDLEYLVKCYIYINNDVEEKITAEDVDKLIKRKNKNVAGTVFLYNPFMVPIGYKDDQKLSEQDFRFNNKFVELEPQRVIRVLGKGFKHTLKGKLIEVKYLFNYNKENIQPTSALEVFDLDLEKIYTDQLTVFSKEDNYHDYKNISYNGSFIFFAWGHKFDKAHTNIIHYAMNIAQWGAKQGKDITYIYDGVMDEQKSFEYIRFLSPEQSGRLKDTMPRVIHDIFSQEEIKPYSIKNLKFT